MPPYLIYVYYVALPILWGRLLPRSPILHLFITKTMALTMALTTERGKAEGKQIINKQNKKEIWWRKQERCDWQLIFHLLVLSIVNYLFWRRVGEKQSCIQSFIHFAFRIQVAFTSENLEICSIMSRACRAWLIENKPVGVLWVSATKPAPSSSSFSASGSWRTEREKLENKHQRKQKIIQKNLRWEKQLRRLLMPISV